MTKSKLQLLAFLVPAAFVALGFVYSDTLYFVIAAVSFFISLLLQSKKKSVNLSVKIPEVKFKLPSFAAFMKKTAPNKKVKVAKKVATKKQERKLSLKQVFLNKYTFIAAPLLSLGFAAVTVLLLPASKQNTNLVFSYFFSWVEFLSHYAAILIALPVLLVVLTAIYIWKKHKIFTPLFLAKSLALKLFVAALLINVSFILALGLSYAYALGHATYVTMGYNMKFVPGKVVTDTKEIGKTIQSAKKMPKVVYYNYSYKKSVVLIKMNANKGFYGKQLATNLPNDVYETIKVPQASLLLVNDTLLITELKEQVLKELSPAFGKFLVSATFKDKNIKTNPKIDLLNRQEYLKLREEQINKDLEKIDTGIAEIDREIAIAAGYVAEGKKQLQEAQDFLNNSESRKNSAISECKSAGEMFMGEFYRYYTDEDCNSLNAEWGNAVSQVTGQLNEIKSTLAHNQNVLAENQAARAYIVSAREFVNSIKDSTPQELGLFLPKEDIKIALDSNNPDVFNAYLATLVHEYLHYTTYVSEERVLDHFFEEALTEHFARKVMKEQLGYSENIGYPVAVKLLEEIIKKVPEDKLREVYFTKDQKQLEYLLNQAYGKNFYEDSSQFFGTINYLPFDESLKAANTVMVRMGEKKISKESVLSN